MIAPAMLTQTHGRSLVSAQLFDRLTARVATQHPELDSDAPARIVDQALAFLGTCTRTAAPLSPSRLVDIGWHTFLLYTREYATFCDRIADGFIHHEPEDGTEWPAVPVSKPAEARRTTIAAMRAAGYHVDAPLWDTKADCTQCHQGCHDSPTR